MIGPYHETSPRSSQKLPNISTTSSPRSVTSSTPSQQQDTSSNSMYKQQPMTMSTLEQPPKLGVLRNNVNNHSRNEFIKRNMKKEKPPNESSVFSVQHRERRSNSVIHRTPYSNQHYQQHSLNEISTTKNTGVGDTDGEPKIKLTLDLSKACPNIGGKNVPIYVIPPTSPSSFSGENPKSRPRSLSQEKIVKQMELQEKKNKKKQTKRRQRIKSK